MKIVYRVLAPLAALGLIFCTGCEFAQTAVKQEFESPAYRPANPGNVRVDVSVNKMVMYVMEGNRPLMVAPVSVGKDNTTPIGSFRIYYRDADRRNRTYGFWVRGDQVVSGKSSQRPGGGGWRFVGYPMAYWSEFKPAYGFHEGSVWPMPRSKGCIRIHPNDAPKFFALTRNGTPVSIRYNQPQDATLGNNVPRPTDYNDPDRPLPILLSSQAFTTPEQPLFEDDKPAGQREKIPGT